MLRRFSVLACAAAVAGAAFVGLTAGTAHADPGCPDVHWIGAAGSGERVDPTADGGMGRVMYQSYRDLARLVQRDGRTITAEAVDYPAVAVPDDDGGVGEWLGFMSSVDAGTAALGAQYASFAQLCPTTKVVLAGYSQGAMVVHRNLTALADNPNVAAALLIADGDRLPGDNVITMGSANAASARDIGCRAGLAHPGACSGQAASEHRKPHDQRVRTWRRGLRLRPRRRRGVAGRGRDPYQLCAQHRRGGYAWTAPVYQLLGPSPTAPQGPLPGPDARAINSTTAPAGSNSAASTATMASTAPAADNPAR